MKKDGKKKLTIDDTMLPEYDFDGMKSVRGKHYKHYREGITITVTSSRKNNKRSTLIVLEPDVALKFKNSKQVNNALRSVIAAKGR